MVPRIELTTDEARLAALGLDYAAERYEQHAKDAEEYRKRLREPPGGWLPEVDEPSYWREKAQEALTLAAKLRG